MVYSYLLYHFLFEYLYSYISSQNWTHCVLTLAYNNKSFKNDILNSLLTCHLFKS